MAIRQGYTIEELEMAVDMAYERMSEVNTKESMEEHFVALSNLQRARDQLISSNPGLRIVPDQERRGGK